MAKAPLPQNEKQRLEALERLQILDTEREKDFDDVVELASIICEVPISLVTMVDASRQWFKAKKGVDISETSRDIAFCSHAIHQSDLFITADAQKDDRFKDNPLVTGAPYIRFYAGMPLATEKGANLGTLCVIDSEPRELSAHQRKGLEILGRQVSNLLELRDKKRQLEDKLKVIASQNEKLESLNKLNAEMTSIISHDMRGPISSVLAYFNSEYFQNASDQEKVNLFSAIKESISGIHHLIENLLEWSQSVGDFKRKPLELSVYVSAVISLFQSQAAQKNILLKNEVDPDIMVLADFSMLRFILRNLIGNAIKFTENGEISVGAVQEKNAADVTITINDNGVGISPELLKRINKGNKKITTPGTQKEKGSGLGLKLINDFLQKHESRLKIESEENKGSTFSFTLNKA